MMISALSFMEKQMQPYPNASSYATANLQMNSYSNRFFAWIQDGQIFADSGSGPRSIGVPLEAYQEIEATAAGYRDRLIELGEIEIPLTQEQVNEKIMTELREERAAREKLMALIDGLTSPPKEVNNGPEKSSVGSPDRNAPGHADSASGE